MPSRYGTACCAASLISAATSLGCTFKARHAIGLLANEQPNGKEDCWSGGSSDRSLWTDSFVFAESVSSGFGFSSGSWLFMNGLVVGRWQ